MQIKRAVTRSDGRRNLVDALFQFGRPSIESNAARVVSVHFLRSLSIMPLSSSECFSSDSRTRDDLAGFAEEERTVSDKGGASSLS